jgi:hypothetical protein
MQKSAENSGINFPHQIETLRGARFKYILH